jgi:hypothetical protein
MPEIFTADFRWPEPPLHGTLEQLFDLMEALGQLTPGATWPKRAPIEGTFLL